MVEPVSFTTSNVEFTASAPQPASLPADPIAEAPITSLLSLFQPPSSQSQLPSPPPASLQPPASLPSPALVQPPITSLPSLFQPPGSRLLSPDSHQQPSSGLPPVGDGVPGPLEQAAKLEEQAAADPGPLSPTSSARSQGQANDDGWQWRKYGEKIIRDNPNPRSYYKCTGLGCTAKKIVDRDYVTMEALNVEYKGEHCHPPPRGRPHSRSVRNHMPGRDRQAPPAPPPSRRHLAAAASPAPPRPTVRSRLKVQKLQLQQMLNDGTGSEDEKDEDEGSFMQFSTSPSGFTHLTGPLSPPCRGGQSRATVRVKEKDLGEPHIEEEEGWSPSEQEQILLEWAVQSAQWAMEADEDEARKRRRLRERQGLAAVDVTVPLWGLVARRGRGPMPLKHLQQLQEQLKQQLQEEQQEQEQQELLKQQQHQQAPQCALPQQTVQ